MSDEWRNMLRRVTLVVFILWLIQRFRRWRTKFVQKLASRSRIIETPHGKIEYVLRGKSNKTILIVHGSPGGCDFWHIYEDLRKEGYTLLCPSRPGYLQTPLQSGRSLTEQAQLIIALLDTLAIAEVAVIAFSGGAPLALHLVEVYPERIKAMIIESGVTHRITIANTPEAWLMSLMRATSIVQRIVYWLTRYIVRAIPSIALWMTFWFTTSHSWHGIWRCMRHIVTHPRQLRLFLHLFDANLPFSHRWAGYANDVEQLEKLPIFAFENMTQPTLILHSLYDMDVPFEHAQTLAHQLPNAQAVFLDGCGHFIWLGQQRQHVLEVRQQFLAAHYSSID